MNASADAVRGGLAGILAALANAPWPSAVGLIIAVVLIGSAQQLVTAWNALLRGIHERRALRSSEPADVLAYMSKTFGDGSAIPLNGSPATPPNEPGAE